MIDGDFEPCIFWEIGIISVYANLWEDQIVNNSSKTLAFARDELVRYFKRMDETADITPTLLVDATAFESLADAELDDAYTVDWHGTVGTITGSNARSVLLGVYELLQQAGCRFFRPGPFGEIVPKRAAAEWDFSFTRVADYRYRGYCIEGSVTEENVRDMVDWLPKRGLNVYFIQFREAHVFFELWHTHRFNEFLPADKEYNIDKSRAIVKRIGEEIRRRGLSYHACGHGWLCESIGFSSTGWHTAKDEEIPDDIRPLLAEINGERKFFGDVPVNTNLCYSSPEVQRRVANEIVSYALEHPEKDMLHVWLADNFNNTCECEECRRLRPTDYYVQILNKVDEQLTAAGSSARISFILYYDLLWTPIQEKLKNPKRFMLLFAPITRTYREPYLKEGEPLPDEAFRMSVRPDEVAPYERNHLALPSGTQDNLKYLYLWQQQFEGDCVIFDYHMMWDIHKNYSQLSLSKVQFRDIELLKYFGLNGYISCQLTRSNFPSGLCNYLLGAKLFDRDADYETVAKEYFEAAFGANWQTARDFLQAMEEGFSWPYCRGELPVVNEEAAAIFRETPQKLYAFRDRLRDGENAAEFPEQKRMWLHLMEATEIYGELALVLYNKASGKPTELVKEQFELFRQNICRREEFLQEVWDFCSFYSIVGTTINKTDAAEIEFDKKA